MRRWVALLALAVGASCVAPRPVLQGPPLPLNPADPSLQGCPVYGEPIVTGTMPQVLAENSGLVASLRHPGLYWGHNDSGNAFELFLIDASGDVKASYRVDTRALDLEAITLGPCRPGSTESCLFVADIGDNLLIRSDHVLYRLREPSLEERGPLPFERLRFELPGKAHNLEALFSDHRTGSLFVISKRRGSLGEVFRVDGLGEQGRAQAVQLAALHDPSGIGRDSVGAADLHPSGERLLIRTYALLYELRLPGAASVEALLQHGKLVRLPQHRQPQSEAAAYARDGRSLLIGSEGAGSPLFELRCR